MPWGILTRERDTCSSSLRYRFACPRDHKSPFIRALKQGAQRTGITRINLFCLHTVPVARFCLGASSDNSFPTRISPALVALMIGQLSSNHRQQQSQNHPPSNEQFQPPPLASFFQFAGGGTLSFRHSSAPGCVSHCRKGF